MQSAADYFYLDGQGEPQGPYTPEQLFALEMLGYLTPQTLVASNGSSQWRPFGEVLAALGPQLNTKFRERLRLPKDVLSPTPPASSSQLLSEEEKDAATLAALGVKSQVPSNIEKTGAGAGPGRWLMPLLLVAQMLLIAGLIALLVPMSARVSEVGGSVTRLSEALPEETARASANATREVFGEFETSLLSRLIPRPPESGGAGAPSPTPASGTPASGPGEVPAFLLKRTSAREVKLDEYLAQLDVQSETMLRKQSPAAWAELELIMSSNAFRGLTQKARESFLSERVAVFREWPDLRFDSSPISRELVRLLRTLGEEDTRRLISPGGLRAVVFDLGRQVGTARVLRQFEDDPLKMPDWEAVNGASRDRAWKMYPAARDLGSPLMARIDEIHRRLEREKHPLLANPYYPWIVTELAADSMSIRPANPYPAPPSAETQQLSAALEAMDAGAMAQEMTSFDLHMADPTGATPASSADALPEFPEVPVSPSPTLPLALPLSAQPAASSPAEPAPAPPPGTVILDPAAVDFAPASPEVKEEEGPAAP